MAITTQLIGKLGADRFEVKTETGLKGSATASVPAGWKSCWVVYQGETWSDTIYRIFGVSIRSGESGRVGGGTPLSGTQTSSISGLKSGGTFTYIRTA